MSDEEETPAATLGTRDEAPADPPATPDTQPAASADPADPTAEQQIANFDQFLEQLPEDIRTDPVFANINKENPVQDLAKQFVNAQKLIGRPVMPKPGENTTAEEWDRIYSSIGRPDTPNEYKMPSDIPEGVEFEKEKLDGFNEMSHKIGLTNDQYKALLAYQANEVHGVMESQSQSSEAAISTMVQEMKKEWGSDYESHMDVANSAFKTLADESLNKLVSSDKALQNHPALLRLFHKLGTEMLEHDLGSGDSPRLAVGGPAQAQSVLKQFEIDNADVLLDASYRGPKNREDILTKRTELYQRAYPPKK